ncbi:MAG: hypothetical protein VW779_03735 [Halieaceae bacterium]
MTVYVLTSRWQSQSYVLFAGPLLTANSTGSTDFEVQVAHG